MTRMPVHEAKHSSSPSPIGFTTNQCNVMNVCLSKCHFGYCCLISSIFCNYLLEIGKLLAIFSDHSLVSDVIVLGCLAMIMTLVLQAFVICN